MQHRLHFLLLAVAVLLAACAPFPATPDLAGDLTRTAPTPTPKGGLMVAFNQITVVTVFNLTPAQAVAWRQAGWEIVNDGMGGGFDCNLHQVGPSTWEGKCDQPARIPYAGGYIVFFIHTTTLTGYAFTSGLIEDGKVINQFSRTVDLQPQQAQQP